MLISSERHAGAHAGQRDLGAGSQHAGRAPDPLDEGDRLVGLERIVAEGGAKARRRSGEGRRRRGCRGADDEPRRDSCMLRSNAARTRPCCYTALHQSLVISHFDACPCACSISVAGPAVLPLEVLEQAARGDARLAWHRHVGDGDEPSRQGVHRASPSRPRPTCASCWRSRRTTRCCSCRAAPPASSRPCR